MLEDNRFGGLILTVEILKMKAKDIMVEEVTNLLSPFPSFIEWVSGGHYVYNPTLKRFPYSL